MDNFGSRAAQPDTMVRCGVRCVDGGVTVRGVERETGVSEVARRVEGTGAGESSSGRSGRGRGRPWSRVWVDPRFVVGVVLVVLSIVGVWWLVTSSSRTVPVYAVTETLTPGTVLDPSQLRIVETRLGAAQPGYLGADTPPGDELIVTRSIVAGELVPLSALGDASSLGVTTLVVEPSGRLGADIDTGTGVDLWSAAPIDDGYGTPEVLVQAAIVVRASEEEGFLARGGSTALELAVPRSSVAAVLAATAAGHLLSVVPTEPGGR